MSLMSKQLLELKSTKDIVVFLTDEGPWAETLNF